MPVSRPGPARRRLTLVAAAGLFLLLAVLLTSQVALSRLKAFAAPVLLQSAAVLAEQREVPVRPWSWADFAVVGRLETPVGNWPLLDRASGQALAFAPGLVEGAGDPLVAGHRDTHFARLGDLAPGDRLHVATAALPKTTYRVTGRRVVHAEHTVLPAGGRTLNLVTCWPLDELGDPGPWRLLVTAEKLPSEDHNLATFATP